MNGHMDEGCEGRSVSWGGGSEEVQRRLVSPHLGGEAEAASRGWEEASGVRPWEGGPWREDSSQIA